MRKSPKVSAMAKILARELANKQDTSLSHVQAMELVAKIHGYRNLHEMQVAEEEGGTKPSDVLFEGRIQDWAVAEGASDDVTPLQKREFQAKVSRMGSSQFVIDMCLPHKEVEDLDGTDQMTLFIEIDGGRPVVHISNDMYGGEQVLTVIGSKDGLYLRPDRTDSYIRTGVSSKEGLREISEDEAIGNGSNLLSHAFIEADNRFED